MVKSADAAARAEATFKRKQEQARDGVQAWQEYEARSHAIAENTKRLRALRLAKEANEAAHSPPTKEQSRKVRRQRNPDLVKQP